MQLNLGMMVDGNARSTFINVLRSLNVRPREMAERKEEIIKTYKEELPKTYIRNARWCVRLGEELFSRTDDSEYVIFVYNMTNRARGHFKGIETAILEVGRELIQKLGAFGEVCLVGEKEEKKRWKELYPELGDVKEAGGNRTVILTGYQRDTGEDDGTKNIRQLDYFIRSTQMRFSGMFLPCMDDTHFIVLSHIPFKYDPSELIEKLLRIKEMDEEHNELNIYSDFVYQLWLEHERTPLSMYITTNALPPKEYFFNGASEINKEISEKLADKKFFVTI